MKRWFMNSVGVLLAVALASAVVSSQGQSSPSAQPSYTPPKTPWGDPDLQGIWPGTDMVGVPFERPERFGKPSLSDRRGAQEREQQAKKQEELDVLDFDLQKPPAEIVALGDVGGVTSPPPHWLERGLPSRQSSLDRSAGERPNAGDDAEGHGASEVGRRHLSKQTGFQRLGSWAHDRCISRGVVGSMMPVVYNNGNEIVQAPGFVAFRNEMIHEVRIIPLDGRQSLPAGMKSYMGRREVTSRETRSSCAPRISTGRPACRGTA